jgi:hypothetical protein
VGSTHNEECEIDGCGSCEELLHCGGCNVSFHPQCMHIHWGLDVYRKPTPWCNDCYDEWEEAKCMDVVTSSSRTATTVGYNPVQRNSGPAIAACPLAAATKGRQRVRFTRAGPQAARNVAFMPCVKGTKCPNECNRVADCERQTIRDEYDKLRRDIKTGTQTPTLTFTQLLTITSYLDYQVQGARQWLLPIHSCGTQS